MAPMACLPTPSITTSPVRLSTGGSIQSTLAISVNSCVQTGNYSILITGNDGTITHSIQLELSATDSSNTSQSQSIGNMLLPVDKLELTTAQWLPATGLILIFLFTGILIFHRVSNDSRRRTSKTLRMTPSAFFNSPRWMSGSYLIGLGTVSREESRQAGH
jgi:hypothetical protein